MRRDHHEAVIRLAKSVAALAEREGALSKVEQNKLVKVAGQLLTHAITVAMLSRGGFVPLPTIEEEL